MELWRNAGRHRGHELSALRKLRTGYWPGFPSLPGVTEPSSTAPSPQTKAAGLQTPPCLVFGTLIERVGLRPFLDSPNNTLCIPLLNRRLNSLKSRCLRQNSITRHISMDCRYDGCVNNIALRLPTRPSPNTSW